MMAMSITPHLLIVLTLLPSFALAEPSTEQLIDKLVRKSGSFFYDDDADEIAKSLRGGEHREKAKTLLNDHINNAKGRDLKDALLAHWSVFGEKSTAPILLKVAKREPTWALVTLENLSHRKITSKALRQWIVDSLKNKNLEIRYHAAGINGNYGEESVQALIDILKNPLVPPTWDQDKKNDLVREVINRMIENGSARFIDPLLEIAEHSHSTPRAVQALMDLQDSWNAASRAKIIARLQDLFNRPYLPGRFAAATALAKLGIPTGTGFLLDGLDAETKFAEMDRIRHLNALRPLLKKDPIPNEILSWEINFAKIAEDLKKDFASKGWPTTDKRTLPTELTPIDEKVFQTLRKGGHQSEVPNQELLKTIDKIVSNPPDFDYKIDNRSPEFLSWAARCFLANDRKRAAQMLDLSRQWGGDDEDLLKDAFASHVVNTVELAITEFFKGNDRKALKMLQDFGGVARQILLNDNERGKTLLDDLLRREKLGILDREPPPISENFDQIPVAQRVRFLINSLDTITVFQGGYPGGVDFSEDPRVAKLIEIGDPAVPSLIDCIESDRRLTRSVKRWRSHTSAMLLGVREPALLALMSIMRIEAFDVGYTSDTFTSRGDAKARELATRLRAYWKKFGHMSLDERMMVVLQAPESSPKELYEAAWNISTLGAIEIIGTTFGTGGIKKDSKGKNPAIAKFDNPTVAEAILAAMDRTITLQREILEPQDDFEIERFTNCLGNLGDPRIEDEMRRRWSSAPDSGPAWPFVIAAKRCGKGALFDEIAEAFADGSLALKVDGKIQSAPAPSDISPFINSFIGFDDLPSQKALAALADSRHPFFPATVRGIARENHGSGDDHWSRHPFWYPVALAALENKRPTGRTFWLTERGYISNSDAPQNGDGIEDWLKALNPASNVTQKELLQDCAALALVDRVPGLPRYHLLAPDREERLARIRFLTKAWAGRMKEPDYDLQKAVGFYFAGNYLTPELTPLTKPATEADVASGRAVFTIKNSQLADLGIPLPAQATIGKGEDAESVAVIQAERFENGKTLCGILGRHRFESVPLSELNNLRPMNAE